MKLNQPPTYTPQVKYRNFPSDAYMIYEEYKATLLNDASSRNNTPKHEALYAHVTGVLIVIFSSWVLRGGGGGGGGGVGPDPQDPPLV